MVVRENILRSWWRGIVGKPVRAELKEFYWFSALFSFAMALVLIFEPVFFYQAGFSLSEIAIFYGLHYTLYFLLLPLGGKFASRFGLEKSLTLSLPLFMAYFLTLAAIEAHLQLFWVAWILLAAFKIFYWPAYYEEYSRFGNELNRGSEVSFGFILTLGVGILGPLIGGFTAAHFGFPALFILVAGMGLLAAGPLLATPERYRTTEFTYTSPWRIIRSRRHRRMVIATLAWVEDFVNLVFWPIFAFIVLNAVDVLGVVASVSVLVMSLLALVVGEWTDRKTSRAVLRLTVPFMSLVYVLRLLSTTIPRVFFVNVLAMSADVSVKIPFSGKLYSQARAFRGIAYNVAFEMVLAMAKAGAAFALAGVFFWWGTSVGFTVAFLAAAVFALFYLKF